MKETGSDKSKKIIKELKKRERERDWGKEGQKKIEKRERE